VIAIGGSGSDTLVFLLVYAVDVSSQAFNEQGLPIHHQKSTCVLLVYTFVVVLLSHTLDLATFGCIWGVFISETSWDYLHLALSKVVETVKV